MTRDQAVIAAALVLGLRFPCTQEQLKAAYRAAAVRLHPDRGGSHAAFVEMQQVYHLIKGNSQLFSDPSQAELKTVQGDLLGDLGLGLGATVNGKDCPECGHAGYTSFRDQRRVDCPHCRGGRVPWRRFYCECGGSGSIWVTSPRPSHTRCARCGGTGEVAMFNPVLPKGQLKR